MDTASDPVPDRVPVESGAPLAENARGEPPAAVPPPNFCTRCGAPWDPAWTECPVCARAGAARRASSGSRVFSSSAPLRSALVLYFALLATSVVGILLTLAGEGPSANVILFIDAVDAAIVLGWVLKDYRRIRDGLVRGAKPLHYLLAVLLGTGTFLFAMLNVKLLGGLVSAEEIRYSDIFLKQGYGWSVVLLTLCVQPPLIEELAFRGVVLGSLRGVLGPSTAVVVSAFLFMTLHLTPLGFPYLFAMGIVAGWLRGWSGSLYPCMALHFTHNFLVVLLEMGGG